MCKPEKSVSQISLSGLEVTRCEYVFRVLPTFEKCLFFNSPHPMCSDADCNFLLASAFGMGDTFIILQRYKMLW